MIFIYFILSIFGAIFGVIILASGIWTLCIHINLNEPTKEICKLIKSNVIKITETGDCSYTIEHVELNHQSTVCDYPGIGLKIHGSYDFMNYSEKIYINCICCEIISKRTKERKRIESAIKKDEELTKRNKIINELKGN